MRKQFVSAMLSIMERDEKVFLLLGDISVYAFRECFSRWPDRCLNIGACEQTMVGVAAGLARQGYYPVLHSIAPFLVERALEQVKIDLAYAGLPALLVSVGASYDYATMGPTHHCPGDVATLLTVPDMNILVPRSGAVMVEQLRDQVKERRLGYLRLSEEDHEEPFVGQYRSKAVCFVLGIGPISWRVARACRDLPVSWSTCSSVRPFLDLDWEPQDRKLLVVEPFLQGTMAGVIAPLLDGTRVRYLGVPHTFITVTGTREEIDAKFGLDEEGIRQTIERFIRA